MKKLLFILLFLPGILNAQIRFTPTIGCDVHFHGFVGAELQGSNVSASMEFRPDYIGSHIYANGFGLFTSFYLKKYVSTPFLHTGIITHPSQIDDITGKPVRSMVILTGYRFYPTEVWRYLDEDISLDFVIGPELMRNSTVRLYAHISLNYHLF